VMVAEASPPTPSVRPLLRAVFVVSLTVTVSAYVIALGLANPDFVSDFDQVWAGARALWERKDPYVVVGPGREFGWNWPLYYPLPALVAIAPLGLLPVIVARALFAGISSGLLAWAVTRDGWSRLPIFISISFLVTIELGQWSAIYAAAFFLPALGVIGITKPNFAVPLVAGAHRPRTVTWLVAGAVVLLVVSQILQPGWHEAWLANVRAAPHFKPHVMRPLGFLLLLAALRWRRPEARWLLALAVVPQAPSFYDQLLLAAVCLTSREALIFAASTVVLFFYVGFNTPQPDYVSWGQLVGNGTLWICYFPALAIVLRRPNEGALPPWAERLASRLTTSKPA
jgi:hypothetical protein